MRRTDADTCREQLSQNGFLTHFHEFSPMTALTDESESAENLHVDNRTVLLWRAKLARR